MTHFHRLKSGVSKTQNNPEKLLHIEEGMSNSSQH